jgi:hypothetical protein
MAYSRGLGDTPPTAAPASSGNGFFSQLVSWFTGGVSEASDDPPAVTAWMAAVKARGNVAVRYPYTDVTGMAGDLAEKYPSGDYVLAPDDVIDADRTRRHLATLETQVIGPVAAAAETTGKTIVNAPISALSGLTGVSPTVVKVALVGAGVLWLVSRRRS